MSPDSFATHAQQKEPIVPSLLAVKLLLFYHSDHLSMIKFLLSLSSYILSVI